jgi:hypothetical protein
MGKPSAPAAPDPTVTAQAQTASNIDTAKANATLNRINQYTPYGSSTYDITGYDSSGIPRYSQTTSLSPVEQGLLNTYQAGQQNLGNIALGMQGQVANSYQNPIDTSQLPGVASKVNLGDTSSQIQQAQDAAYKGQTQYLDPQYARAQEQLQNQLSNQGIPQGSEAWNNAMNQFNEQKQAAYGNAGLQAVQAGNQEQNTLFGQGLSSADLQNQAQAQGMQQLFALRNQPLNEYNSLISGAQVQNPSFSATPVANQANTDIAGITNQGYQNQLAQYNAQTQAMNNLFSLGGNLGAAAILAA